MREPSELKSLVRKAIDETRAIRILLGVAGGVLGATVGVGVMEFVPEDWVSNRSYTVIVSVCAGLLAYVSSIASEVIVHRKIRRLAGSV